MPTNQWDWFEDQQERQRSAYLKRQQEQQKMESGKGDWTEYRILKVDPLPTDKAVRIRVSVESASESFARVWFTNVEAAREWADRLIDLQITRPDDWVCIRVPAADAVDNITDTWVRLADIRCVIIHNHT